jgi:hypothetical protein
VLPHRLQGQGDKARCYQQTGFWLHRLLRLAVQQEMTLADREEQKGDQSRNRAAGADRPPKDAPPEKIRPLNNGEQRRGKRRKAHPPKQVATWYFSAFDSRENLVWLRATKN